MDTVMKLSRMSQGDWAPCGKLKTQSEGMREFLSEGCGVITSTSMKQRSPSSHYWGNDIWEHFKGVSGELQNNLYRDTVSLVETENSKEAHTVLVVM